MKMNCTVDLETNVGKPNFKLCNVVGILKLRNILPEADTTNWSYEL